MLYALLLILGLQIPGHWAYVSGLWEEKYCQKPGLGTDLTSCTERPVFIILRCTLSSTWSRINSTDALMKTRQLYTNSVVLSVAKLTYKSYNSKSPLPHRTIVDMPDWK